MNKAFQRKGGKSNAHIGREFEDIALNYFENKGMKLERNYKIDIGIKYKKPHKFDLGNDDTLIECKTLTWTESEKIPSAKIKNINEAMYYFYLAPKKYKKIFFGECHFSQERCKSFILYYIEKNYHFIPEDVVFYDYIVETNDCKIYTFDDISKMITKV